MGFFEIFAAALAAFYALIPSYGIAIILLTISVRLLLLPLSIKQTRSMKEMQRIQPEIKKIQQKYRGDRQKMNEEMMALYKEHGVNPFGGCGPMLLQLPVLIALFYVIRSPLRYLAPMEDSLLASHLDTPGKALEVHRFLGLRLDCSAGQFLGFGGAESQSIEGASCGSGAFELVGIIYLVLILLMGFTTWYQQKQMQASRDVTNDPQARQMQMFGKIMPIMLVVFAYTFPAGVVLYWVTTNVWTIVQQQIIFRAAPPLPSAPRAEAEGDGKPAGKAAPKLGRGKSSKEAAEAGDGQKSTTDAAKKAQKRTGEAAKNSGKAGGRSSARSGGRSSGKKKKKR